MANINFKFDMKKFEKDLNKEIEKTIRKKQRELIIRDKIIRRSGKDEFVT